MCDRSYKSELEGPVNRAVTRGRADTQRLRTDPLPGFFAVNQFDAFAALGAAFPADHSAAGFFAQQRPQAFIDVEVVIYEVSAFAIALDPHVAGLFGHFGKKRRLPLLRRDYCKG